MEWTLMEP